MEQPVEVKSVWGEIGRVLFLEAHGVAGLQSGPFISPIWREHLLLRIIRYKTGVRFSVNAHTAHASRAPVVRVILRTTAETASSTPAFVGFPPLGAAARCGAVASAASDAAGGRTSDQCLWLQHAVQPVDGDHHSGAHQRLLLHGLLLDLHPAMRRRERLGPRGRRPGRARRPVAPRRTRPRSRRHRDVPDLRVLGGQEPQAREGHAGVRRLPERVRRRRDPPPAPQMQPCLPPRLHRRLALQPHHLSRLPVKPRPRNGGRSGRRTGDRVGGGRSGNRNRRKPTRSRYHDRRISAAYYGGGGGDGGSATAVAEPDSPLPEPSAEVQIDAEAFMGGKIPEIALDGAFADSTGGERGAVHAPATGAGTAGAGDQNEAEPDDKLRVPVGGDGVGRERPERSPHPRGRGEQPRRAEHQSVGQRRREVGSVGFLHGAALLHAVLVR
ncbi:hypothetical protein H6P81_010710 [Aristolochia fimbriata]|uniref:Uncharacterized protein n=1 Tax=Aristolochia fimbriata TaxID=158543 RepID=A0AAV7ERM7_ARIFI|nr:hypothetical protein H6P81_010710 [Aristolochia fimbriata]